MGQAGFFEAISRANSHLRYWKHRREVGNPIALTMALKQWIRRFAFEWAGIGNGA